MTQVTPKAVTDWMSVAANLISLGVVTVQQIRGSLTDTGQDTKAADDAELVALGITIARRKAEAQKESA